MSATASFFAAQTIGTTGRNADGSELLVTFRNSDGEQLTLTIPTRVAAESLIPVLAHLSATLKGGRTATATMKLVSDCNVTHADTADMVLIHLDDESFTLPPSDARKLAQLLMDRATLVEKRATARGA